MLLGAAAIAGVGNCVFHPGRLHAAQPPRLDAAPGPRVLGPRPLGQPRLGGGAGVRDRAWRRPSAGATPPAGGRVVGLRARVPRAQSPPPRRRAAAVRRAARRAGGTFAFLGRRRGVDVLRVLLRLGDGLRRAAELRAADLRARLRRHRSRSPPRASPPTCWAARRERRRAASSPRRASGRIAWSPLALGVAAACARSRSPRRRCRRGASSP